MFAVVGLSISRSHKIHFLFDFIKYIPHAIQRRQYFDGGGIAIANILFKDSSSQCAQIIITITTGLYDNGGSIAIPHPVASSLSSVQVPLVSFMITRGKDSGYPTPSLSTPSLS
jgi:hypothetical protein